MSYGFDGLRAEKARYRQALCGYRAAGASRGSADADSYQRIQDAYAELQRAGKSKHLAQGIKSAMAEETGESAHDAAGAAGAVTA